MSKTIKERAQEIAIRHWCGGEWHPPLGNLSDQIAAAMRELREECAMVPDDGQAIPNDELARLIRKIGEPEPEPPVIEHDTFTKALQDQVMRVLIPRLYPNLMVLDATPEEIAREWSDTDHYSESELVKVIRRHLKPMPTKETR